MFVSSRVSESVRQDCVQAIGLRYEVKVKSGGEVVYCPLLPDFLTASDVIKKKSMAVKSWPASANKISKVLQAGTPSVELEGVQQVKPAAALAHEVSFGHSVSVRPDVIEGKRTKLLLDYPMPIELNVRSWRCRTRRGSWPGLCFPVLPSDITHHFPGSVRVHVQEIRPYLHEQNVPVTLAVLGL